ncbi:hypothetical protein KP509_14G011500 [Ceratopteris richardii]|uniref:Uncharacterized protein n=1 Tax=Ceratopteris richardii TaxID=49495 RepID=A0A8T2T7W8_CERRI|nr:hypothetical protein KP509_14G011500 [Ceratopteris richardii]
MAPSWPGPVPPHLNDGSPYPAMTAYALPSELSPGAVPSAMEQRVESMLNELLPLNVLPLNLAPGVAQALIIGIQSVFNVQDRTRR